MTSPEDRLDKELRGFLSQSENTISKIKDLLQLQQINPEEVDANCAPSDLSICLAAKAIVDIGASGSTVTDVNIDAIGGVAVYFDIPQGPSAWLCILNNGHIGCVNMETGKTIEL